MKISIITVCYNSEKTIEDTLKSVLNQTYKNYEYIIIDGKSTDKTLDILKKYEKKFKGRMKIISEKDKGLYDAMNKGILNSTGDIIGIINSDDIIANKYIFSRIVENLKDSDYDGIYSDLVYMDSDSMKIPYRNFIGRKYKKVLGWHPPHPTLYLRKYVYEKTGNYNLNYRIAADMDFMLRSIKLGFKYKYVKDYFVIMRAGGVSTNGLKGYLKNMKESNLVLKNNNVLFPYLTNVERIFKTIWQGVSAKLFKKSILKKLNDSQKKTI